MTIDFCALCSDPCLKGPIGNDNMTETWRLLVAQALCSLNSALAAQQTGIPEVQLSAATLQASYAAYTSPGFITAAKKLNRIRFNNTVDAVIEVSIDNGVTTFMTVPALTDTGFLNVGNITFTNATDFKIRRASGDAATTGTLFIQGSYSA